MPPRVPALIAAILIFASVSPSQARAQSAPTLGQYYLALGDSLAYGITAPGIPPDPQCIQANATGYVCSVFGYLKQVNPQLHLENLGIPEADSCVLAHGFGNGSPCANPPTPGTTPAPLGVALAFIKDHPGQIGFVTINVGGADLVPLLPAAVADPAGTAAKLPKLFQAYQANLDTTLLQLRDALGATPEIILVTQYNPLGGIGSPPLPPGLPAIANGAIGSLNSLMKAVAAKHDVRVADAAAAFDANPGGAALLTFVPTSLASGDPTKLDIYPTEEGYRLLGTTILKTSAYAVTAFVKVKLAHPRVKKGKKLTISGATVSGSNVTLTVTLPHAKARKSVALADNNGGVSFSLSAGKRAGTGKARLCATDVITGAVKCASKSFTVR